MLTETSEQSSSQRLEVVKVKSAFFKCFSGCWLGLGVFVKVYSRSVKVYSDSASRRERSNLSFYGDF